MKVSEEDLRKRKDQTEKEKVNLDEFIKARTKRTVAPLIDVMQLNCKEKTTFQQQLLFDPEDKTCA